MQSPFASWMDCYAQYAKQKGLADVPQPDENDALNQSLSKRGYVHEEAFIDTLTQQGKQVYTVSDKQSKPQKISDTLSAMQRGEEVIFQAYLAVEPFRGFADFLIKTPGKSKLGDYHYEVWDTKLSKQVKAKFLIQLCAYADMLETLQGTRPSTMAVVLGDQTIKSYGVEDYFYYYLSIKQSFLNNQAQFCHDVQPDPANYKDWGRWSDVAKEQLTERDHLFQVATITYGQIKKLNQANIETLEQLANSSLQAIPKLEPLTFQRLKSQASIQLASRQKGGEIPCYEILVPEPSEKLGLALLPSHSPLDVFFDIEGFPLDDGGLEYLWGNTYFDDKGSKQFKDFWAHNPQQERQSFIAFIDWVFARWQQDPQMHVYHYANYEIAAIKKLMGRHGVCEHQVDELLRNEVFVDLYKIVKGGVLLGEPRYSIKNVEHLYRGKRDTEVGNGADSVVVYENWREEHAQGKQGDTWQTSKILNDIREYNIDDCDSTQELVDWLRLEQQKHNIRFQGKVDKKETEIKEEITQKTNLRDRLLKQAEQEGLDSKQGLLTQNLAWMLEFHRREVKPVYWKLFERLGSEAETLIEDLDCLANCIRTPAEPFKLKPRDRSLCYEFSFNPNQEFKGAKLKFYVNGVEIEKGKSQGNTLKVEYISEHSDLSNGIIVVKSSQDLPNLVSLIPDEIVGAGVIEKSLQAYVEQYEQKPLQQNAALDFLMRHEPRIKDRQPGTPIIHSSNTLMHDLTQAVLNLDNSYLPIQGPPGAGKTYSGKHLIAALVKQGYKVGVTSNSHKALNNLLIATAQHCQKIEQPCTFACRSNTGPEIEQLDIQVKETKNFPDFIQQNKHAVVGSTAWTFASEAMAGQLDYLFIDEAGQVSVANLIAMSQCANNIVILGDQMQLGQPTQGSHPLDSGLSILDYLLKDQPTIADNMGVFLGATYRMHSAINQFISGAIYENKLHSHPDNDKQILLPPQGKALGLKSAGIQFVPVAHNGNTQSSEEEIEKIIELTQQLLTCQYQDKQGDIFPITFDQILFVAPYNHQVNILKQALEHLPNGQQAKVGSVDKFQGQEAPVVIYSLCASDPNESPRGMEFLFDTNRLNVAISRAKSLAIVVGNPALKAVSVSKPKQMKLANIIARLIGVSSCL
jgi:uncharacterized protein